MPDAKEVVDQRAECADEALIPARLVLDERAFDRIVELLERPPSPTVALCELMHGQGG